VQARIGDVHHALPYSRSGQVGELQDLRGAGKRQLPADRQLGDPVHHGPARQRQGLPVALPLIEPKRGEKSGLADI